MHFLPLHLLYLFFTRNSATAPCIFLSALALGSEGACCYAHTAAVSVEQNPVPHPPIRWKVGQGTETSFGRDHLGLKWWTASLSVAEPTAF